MKGLSKYGKLERQNFKWIYLFLLPTVIIFCMFYVQPICVMLYTSFTQWDGFNAASFNGLRNYVRIFTNSATSSSLWNLLWWSVIATTLHTGFGVLVAFVLFYKPIGWKFTRAVYMIPNVISGAAWALIYRFIFNDQVGMLNAVIRVFSPEFSVQWFYQSPYAFWAVTFTWLFYAVIVTLIVLNDLMAIPPSLLEAANLDGCSGIQLLLRVQLPLCRVSIGTAVLCSITSRISMYEAIALTTGGGPGDDTMSLSVLLVQAISNYQYGFANAIGVIMFIFGLVIMLVINKAFKMGDSVY